MKLLAEEKLEHERILQKQILSNQKVWKITCVACPITCELFVEPVLTADNITYEKQEEWFKKHKTSPKTN